MSVLVYIDASEGTLKKKNHEVVNYAAKTANTFGGEVTALVIGNVSEDEAKTLGNFGADKVLVANSEKINEFNAQNHAETTVNAVKLIGAKFVIFSFDMSGKTVAPIVSSKLKAGLVAGAVGYPKDNNGVVIKKSVFSGKAFANVKINSDVKIISVIPNSHPLEEIQKTASVSTFADVSTPSQMAIKSKEVVTGEVPLSEAELVVSGGRGMKGPENWGLLEDLAKTIGASLACSRPVADSHWRPHPEHVGQTGGTIRPNLYIAVGISGAIQHLAGVNNSKTIVVINKDPEAPFFKAADYGVVGDLFEVVPKLTEALKNYKK